MAIPPASVGDNNTAGWRFDNSYSRLPEVLFAPATPARVRKPQVSILNHRLAHDLGLELGSMSSETAAAVFSGQDLPAGSLPIAQAYAGHQFGGFTILGDGRAILLGEHRTPSGRLVDIQLKGSGRTPFSRGGDGLAALGPMLREYVISEAMAALGIPTTRSLAVVTTGDSVYRTTPLRGAILTRVASSHIRVGTFQYLRARGDQTSLVALANYAIDRHFPELTTTPQKYQEFLRSVADRQASLVAQWQLVGFIHGVMNTDNMSISGETIDYGPCAFMNAYNPSTVFSSIDQFGRYAYGNQPGITQWNLTRFAETLLPLLDADQDKAIAIATEILNRFPARFEGYWLAGMRKKLGFQTEEAGDLELIHALLDWMEKSKADFTNTFADLSSGKPLDAALYHDQDFSLWYSRWQERLRREGQPMALASDVMRTVNPLFIPRNHRVEEALLAAEKHDDLSVLHRLLEVLSSPYEMGADQALYRDPPTDDSNYRTFCGT